MFITVLTEHSVPTDGDMVINSDSTVKRLWIQIPFQYSVPWPSYQTALSQKFSHSDGGDYQYLPNKVMVKMTRDEICKERT